MIYDRDNYVITLSTFDKDNNLIPLGGPEIGFQELVIRYELNKFASASLSIVNNNWFKTLNYKNLHVHVLIKNINKEIKFTLGVTNQVIDNRGITFNGLMTKTDNFLISESEYLGTTLTGAINRLNFEQKFLSNSSITGSFYRIDEPKVSILKKLLLGAQLNYSYIITDEYIKLINPTYSGKVDYTLDSNIGEIHVVTNIKDSNYRYGFTGNFETASLFGSRIISQIENNQYNTNMLYNSRFFLEGFDITFDLELKNYIKALPGDYVGFPTDNFTKNSILVIGKSVKFDTDISTRLILGAYTDDLK